MDMQLKDKVIIVTGGAKGIGAGIVRACAAEGASPVIVGRDAETGKALQTELLKNGDLPAGNCADLGKVRTVGCTSEQCRRERLSWAGTWKSRRICYFVESQSGPLLLHGALRAAPFETIQGFDREHRLEDRSHGPGKHLRLRLL